MKRYWLSGLILSLGGITSGASAGEVVATSSARVPVATTEANMGSPFATLGQPRTINSDAPVVEAPRLLPASYREPAQSIGVQPAENPTVIPAAASLPEAPGAVVPAITRPTGETEPAVRPAVF